MNLAEFENKTLLITNHNLINLAGSELTTYYLAKEFIRYGAKVTIAVFCYDYPIRQYFEDEGIKVYNILNETLPENHYDLIWSHHSPVLSDCIFEKNITADRIIFSSLSPYEPLEAPPIYANLLSLCLANSCETRDKLIDEGVIAENITVFNNSIDDSYFNNYLPSESKILGSICIISNHVPNELRELSSLLISIGVACDFYGISDQVKLINADLINQYDAVITIGRTVQYALALGIPVYCYDRFGGPGWITPENIERSEYYNFSGRCTNRLLNANTIFSEIINDYTSIIQNRTILQKYAKAKFSLTSNIESCLMRIENKPVDIIKLKKQYNMSKRINEYYEQKLTTLYIKENEVNSMTDKLNEIYSSRGWKLLSLYYLLKYHIKNGLRAMKQININDSDQSEINCDPKKLLP